MRSCASFESRRSWRGILFYPVEWEILFLLWKILWIRGDVVKLWRRSRDMEKLRRKRIQILRNSPHCVRVFRFFFFLNSIYPCPVFSISEKRIINLYQISMYINLYNENFHLWFLSCLPLREVENEVKFAKQDPYSCDNLCPRIFYPVSSDSNIDVHT